MNLRLLFWSAVLYAVLLVLVRGIFPSESAPTISLLGIPLIVIVIMIARDLARRSTSPTVRRTTEKAAGVRENPLQFLSGQFKVAANASNLYFQNAVQLRLRELLTVKVALATGFDSESVRSLLSDPKNGPVLLRNRALYQMLYGPPPRGGLERITMIGKAIDLIGAWKG